MSQLSDDDLIELLGGQPNTGVANTFGFGNLPDYGVPNIMTADDLQVFVSHRNVACIQLHGHAQLFLPTPGTRIW